ncbi:MAG: SusD/RagB family nutrient-binding outer membrane lipoprotein [Flavobacteriales bacterium]|nr:SusD/RagB family nutrient-binding outer membrane lipoprotein [Flavobacteriales bacterium]
MKTKKYIVLGLIAASAISCTKLEDLNKDKKNPTEVSGNAIFSNALKNLCDQEASTNVNRNVFRLFSQYWTETTYTDESNYNITTRSIPDYAWRTWYRDVLMDLKEANRLIMEESPVTAADQANQANRSAITEVLSVYAYQHLVDLFGNVPYDEALNIDNVLPAYEDAQSIYSKLFARLDAAIAKLNPSLGDSFEDADLMYGGDVAMWKKFAYSLKLKMAVNVGDVAALNPATAAADAVAGGVFTSSADNAVMNYLGSQPNTNPVYVDLVASGRNDFVVANTIVDIMNTLNDPRRDDYFAENLGAGTFTGGIYGASNSFSSYSHVADALQDPTAPMHLMDYAEVLFYQAEAVERGFIGGSADLLYAEAVATSILDWGGTAGEAATYLAQADVAYATAPGTWQEKIGKQAWLAYYNRGFLGWTTWRRLDAPAMNPAALTTDPLPVRFTYAVNEQTLNGANYTSAAAAIGGDLQTTKLFWDKY